MHALDPMRVIHLDHWMIDGSIKGAPAWFGPAVTAAVAVALVPVQNTSARGCNSSVIDFAGRRLTPLVDAQVGWWLVLGRYRPLSEQC